MEREYQNRVGPIKCKIVGYADCDNYIRALTFEMFHVNEIIKSTPDNCRNIYSLFWIWTCVIMTKYIHKNI